MGTVQHGYKHRNKQRGAAFTCKEKRKWKFLPTEPLKGRQAGQQT